MKRSNKGLSLIELMVAIAIIAIIAAIALPGLLSGKRTSNATAAFANLKSFSTAMATYIERKDDQSYPENLENVADYYSHIENKGGYKYVYDSNKNNYIYYAYPTGLSIGTKIYFVDESNNIYEATVDNSNFLVPPTINILAEGENKIEVPVLNWEKKS